MKNYVGSKIMGFRFKNRTNEIGWDSRMKERVGQVGVIIDQCPYSVIVEFEGGGNSRRWAYPITEVEQYLIK